jgi:NADPH-dependent glutamate synthase beta subunit-like oxidoreductase
MDTNSIIVAVGTIPDIPSTFNLKVGKENTVQVDAETLATYREGVYAGGDMVSGAASVVEAIALGRKAAIAMDKYLGGKGVMGKSEPSSDGTMNWVGFEEDILDIGRLPVPTLPVKERIDNFAEVKLGFSKEMAKREINRCLHCDQSILLEVDIDRCTNCYTCQLICSLVYEGVCNPEKARILIGGDEINYSSECVASCSLCIQHCPQDALLLKG